MKAALATLPEAAAEAAMEVVILAAIEEAAEAAMEAMAKEAMDVVIWAAMEEAFKAKAGVRVQARM
jgi:hypothetical protein